MKFISLIKNTIFSLFLLFIYWDSTLWKASVNYLGEDHQRVIYGLLSMGLLIVTSIIYFGFLNFLQSRIPDNKRKKIPKYPKGILYILIGVFSFKFLVFGDLGVNIESEQGGLIELHTPRMKQESLNVYDIGQVKGNNGWRDIYRGFYLVEDLKTNEQYVIGSRVVSGNQLKEDIVNEYTDREQLLLVLNKNIKVSEKDNVQNFFERQSLDFKTNVYQLKTDGFTMFFWKLLYWGVFAVIFIATVFLIVLSLPE